MSQSSRGMGPLGSEWVLLRGPEGSQRAQSPYRVVTIMNLAPAVNPQESSQTWRVRSKCLSIV